MTTIDEESAANYKAFRGRCKELSEAAIVEDPTLTLVRGKYFCPIWNTEEPHWWTVRLDGTINDPSKLQFPSRGQGYYEPFDGFEPCAECGAEVAEKDFVMCGNYICCSNLCCLRLVGL